jgi:hypothetical protein
MCSIFEGKIEYLRRKNPFPLKTPDKDADSSGNIPYQPLSQAA